MNILRRILAIMVVVLASYGLITGTTAILMPFALLLLGLMFIVMGVLEYRKRKAISVTLFLVAGFTIFVSIYTF